MRFFRADQTADGFEYGWKAELNHLGFNAMLTICLLG